MTCSIGEPNNVSSDSCLSVFLVVSVSTASVKQDDPLDCPASKADVAKKEAHVRIPSYIKGFLAVRQEKGAITTQEHDELMSKLNTEMYLQYCIKHPKSNASEWMRSVVK